MSRIIYLSPRSYINSTHGSYDTAEKIAKIIERELKLRSVDVYIPSKSTKLHERDDEVTKIKADTFIEILDRYTTDCTFKNIRHENAFRIAYPIDDIKSKNFAIQTYKTIHRNLSRFRGLATRKTMTYHTFPKGTIDSTIEIFDNYMGDIDIEGVGVSIAYAICRYLGVEWGEIHNKVYRIQVGDTFTNKKMAEKFVKDLNEKGIDAFVI